MRVRRANRDDVPALAELHYENENSSNWSQQHFESLCRAPSSELSEICFIVLEDPAESQSASLPSPKLPIAGYLYAHGVADEWDLQFIIVGKKYQRRGLATMLLNELIAHVRSKNGSRIHLEVRASNQAAKDLYRNFEFKVTRIRENYYPAPQQEDAICYMLDIC
jgi:ribosomal protein S18 acetylase RimI-like enzyme